MTSKTYQAAVLGSPIEHSKSPDIHRAAYTSLGVPIHYNRVEVTEGQADDFMSSLTRRYCSTQHLAGFSVTMPLKAALVPHMRHVSTRVARLGVLNTVVFDHNGDSVGYNTDVDGICHALTSVGSESGGGGSMGILGAGGTASAAIAAAADMGMDAIVLYVRNRQRAQESLAVAQQFDVDAQVRLLSDLPQHVQDHRAVVATLPAGATDWLVEQLPEHGLPPLLDVIYEPWPTLLAAKWMASGANVASGMDMLLYQGVEQVKLFTQKIVKNHDDIDWQTITTHMATALGIARL